jgi:hypothetical protein
MKKRFAYFARQCTAEYKINVVSKTIRRELFGLKEATFARDRLVSSVGCLREPGEELVQKRQHLSICPRHYRFEQAPRLFLQHGHGVRRGDQWHQVVGCRAERCGKPVHQVDARCRAAGLQPPDVRGGDVRFFGEVGLSHSPRLSHLAQSGGEPRHDLGLLHSLFSTLRHSRPRAMIGKGGVGQ